MMVVLIEIKIIIIGKCFFLIVCKDNANMSKCDKIDISEGNDVNKTGASKKGTVFHYWYFFR